MLKNAPTLAIGGVDREENEHCKVCPLSVYIGFEELDWLFRVLDSDGDESDDKKKHVFAEILDSERCEGMKIL